MRTIFWMFSAIVVVQFSHARIDDELAQSTQPMTRIADRPVDETCYFHIKQAVLNQVRQIEKRNVVDQKVKEVRKVLRFIDSHDMKLLIAEVGEKDPCSRENYNRMAWMGPLSQIANRLAPLGNRLMNYLSKLVNRLPWSAGKGPFSSLGIKNLKNLPKMSGTNVPYDFLVPGSKIKVVQSAMKRVTEIMSRADVPLASQRQLLSQVWARSMIQSATQFLKKTGGKLPNGYQFGKKIKYGFWEFAFTRSNVNGQIILHHAKQLSRPTVPMSQ